MTKRVLTQTFGVVGAILERDGKILLGRRFKNVCSLHSSLVSRTTQRS